MPMLFLDIESRSKADLKNCGAWRYCAHGSTEPLFLCWAVDDGDVQTWRPGEPVPAPFRATADTPANWSIIAHNFGFELPFYQLILTPRFGFPPDPARVVALHHAAGAGQRPSRRTGASVAGAGVALSQGPESHQGAARSLAPEEKGRLGRGSSKLELVHQRCITDVIAARAVWDHAGLRHIEDPNADCRSSTPRSMPGAACGSIASSSPPPEPSPPTSATASTSGCLS